MTCEHDIEPCAGYGATIGVHPCVKCGKLVTWEKDKYILMNDKVHLIRRARETANEKAIAISFLIPLVVTIIGMFLYKIFKQ